MCFCLSSSIFSSFSEPLSLQIPEFNREFLGGSNHAFWWDRDDYESRHKAFEKLESLYWSRLNFFEKFLVFWV